MYALLPVPATVLNVRIQTIFDRKLGFKGTNRVYIRDQEVKIYQIRHFVWNLSKICTKSKFWRPYWIFYQPFWPEVDDVESLNSIPSLVMILATYIMNFKKIGSKLWPWQCHRARIQNGCRDVINYANEPKLKRTPLDHWGTIFWKFSWNQPSSFALLARTDTHTHRQTHRHTD